MALQTFLPSRAPDPGTEDKPEIKLLEAEFGDGYTQIAPNGVNNVRRVLALTWTALHPTNAAYITSFLAAHKGAIPFFYTPSDELAPTKWSCKEWGDVRDKGGLRNITATFRQDFSMSVS